jgi:hypothetical protein
MGGKVMSELKKEDMLAYIPDKLTEKGTAIAVEEILNFEKENPGINIPADLRETIVQRSIADLSFSFSEFRTHAFTDMDDFKEHFEKWYADRAEPALHRMISTNIRTEAEKLKKEQGEPLSFIDSFRKQVHEQAQNPDFHL